MLLILPLGSGMEELVQHQPQKARAERASAKAVACLFRSVLFIVIIAVPVFSLKRRIFKESLQVDFKTRIFRGTEHKHHREFISAP